MSSLWFMTLGPSFGCFMMPCFFLFAPLIVLAMVARFFRTVFVQHSGRGPEFTSPGLQVCDNRKCGHLNRRSARFCARCGGPLSEYRGG